MSKKYKNQKTSSFGSNSNQNLYFNQNNQILTKSKNKIKEIKPIIKNSIQEKYIFKNYTISSRSGESFRLSDVDFDSIVPKIKFSQNEKVPSGCFNQNLFSSVAELLLFVKNLLPKKMVFDSNGRFEITIELNHNYLGEEIGWQGIIHYSILTKKYNELDVGMKMYDPKGICGIVDGIMGNWFPESFLDQNTGKVKVILDDNDFCIEYSKIDNEGYLYNKYGEKIGKARNPKFRFEPLYNFVYIPESLYRKISKTNRITIIIKKDQVTNKPTVSKLYPGSKIAQKPYKLLDATNPIDLLHDQAINIFWNEHIIVDTIPDLFGNFPNLRHKAEILKEDNLENVIKWLKKEVEHFVKFNYEIIDAFNIEDLFQEICVLLAKKRGIPVENIPLIKLDSIVNERNDKIDLKFMDKTILHFKKQFKESYYSIIWNEKALQKSLSMYIERLSIR